ncbi:hypothetical protein [Tellurirhabdus rosea]|uniref:hypothetical protein n=1 Tax=Tellurirhabdus rosea TaxID=2674997 RepID=UPI0022511AA9|nr:hypothetical protein [Tellurirhabdus rosea]
MEHTELTDILRAPCSACGSQMRFSADKQTLACDHCGNTEPLVFTRTRLNENPLQFRLENNALPSAPTEEKRVFGCARCGARTTVNFDNPTITCAFCGSKNVNPDAVKTRLIEPAGVLPFRISRQGAMERFSNWVGSDWLAPSDLKAGAMLDNLHGMYIPFWTFDAQAQSEWEGEAGHYYYVPVQVRDSNGRMVTQQQQRVRWEYRSGHHEAFYDDLLEMASRNLTQQESHVQEVSRYELQEVVDYDPRILLGWEAEVYSIDLVESARKAEEQIQQREETACANLVGGDAQRNLHVRTQLSDQSFKHLLLPLWICSYMYNGKLYRFLVNGQTGQVAGQRPKSALKIALLVLAFLLLVFFFWYLGKR